MNTQDALHEEAAMLHFLSVCQLINVSFYIQWIFRVNACLTGLSGGAYVSRCLLSTYGNERMKGLSTLMTRTP